MTVAASVHTVHKAAEKVLDKVIRKSDEEVPIGPTPIDATIQISLKGILNREPPQSIQGTPATPWPVVLALLAMRLKASRAHAQQVIGEVLRAAFAFGDDWPTALAFPDRVRDAEEEIDKAQQGAEKIPKTRAGNTTWTGSAEIAIV